MDSGEGGAPKARSFDQFSREQDELEVDPRPWRWEDEENPGKYGEVWGGGGARDIPLSIRQPREALPLTIYKGSRARRHERTW